MKKSRFSEQQMAFILKQAEDGTTVEEVCRKAGISIQTYYRWRSKYGGFGRAPSPRHPMTKRAHCPSLEHIDQPSSGWMSSGISRTDSRLFCKSEQRNNVRCRNKNRGRSPCLIWCNSDCLLTTRPAISEI
ncbi:MAG: transposase [Sphingorhabdus sp.]|nr:transposase [Sphingorhabdus sp.]